MSKTSELYTAIIKDINSQGFDVTCTINKITVKNPGTETIVFGGDIEQAQDWLLNSDFNQYPKIHGTKTPVSYIPVERPPFRRNSAICCVFCIMIFLGAIALDHNPGTLLLGLPGVWFFILAFFNTANHLKWERKISEISR